jgi:predicted dehydrogenase
MSLADLHVVVVGCGSIGSRHARNLRTLGVGALALCDLDASRALRLATDVGATATGGDLGVLLKRFRPDAVLVCTPPVSHLAIARRAIAAGTHVFCEKPLATDLDGIDALETLVAERRRVFMMGMCYRFHPALRRMKVLLDAGTIGRVLGATMWAGQYLPDWHPWADYRREYSAQRALGGGVLLDSIHSFDTLRWVLGEPVEVTGMLARVSDLEIDTEDVAAALVRLPSGAIVEVHVDYLQRVAQSRFDVIGSEGTLAWDREGVRWRRAGDQAWTVEDVQSQPNAMYLAELEAFGAAVAAGHTVLGIDEGRATLSLAAAIRESATTGRCVRLVPPAPSAASMEAHA